MCFEFLYDNIHFARIRFIFVHLSPSLFTLPLTSSPSSPLLFLLLVDPLTEHLLISELITVTGWYQLGIQLKIPSYILDTCYLDHSMTDDRRSAMLIWWFKHAESRSWSEVVRALLRINNELAQKIAVKYGMMIGHICHYMCVCMHVCAHVHTPLCTPLYE